MADVTRLTETPVGTLDTTYIQAKAIDTLENKLVMTDFITPGELPMNSGSILRWHIDDTLEDPSAYNALTNDATTNGGNELSYSNRDTMNEETFTTKQVEQQIQTYGAYIPVRTSDLDDMPKTVMDRISKQLGYRGAKVLDTLTRAAADGSGDAGGVFYPHYGPGTSNISLGIASGGDAGVLEAGDTLTAEDVALAVGKLWGVDAVEFDDGRYKGIVHSGAAIHLVTDVDASRMSWQEMNKYVSGFTGQEKLIAGHLGAIIGCDMIRSNNMDDDEVVDTLASYTNLILAKDAIGMVSRGDFEPSVHINRADSGSMSDPHRLWATLAFQFQAAPQLLDELRVVKLSTAQA